MKVYFSDRYKKYKNLKNELENEFLLKEVDSYKIKQTKTDVVIICEDIEKADALEIKDLKNIFFITSKSDVKSIWRLANDYNTIDIISRRSR